MIQSKFILQFGGSLTKAHQDAYEKSKHWDGKKFVNLNPKLLNINFKTFPGLLKAQFKDRKLRSPERPIEIIPFNVARFEADGSQPKFVWFGHSALLLQINGKNLLIDPMLGDNASPIAPFATSRFSKNSLDIIDALPPIDAILLTHDHYDHLDLDSINKLKGKVDTYFVALGVSRHLEKWGIPRNQITEFDWWDDLQFDDIGITFTPSRHFSGRGATDRAKSLWGGWVFQTPEHSLYWSGDGGYDSHFKEVGDKLGPFDWAFVECGQYNEHWHHIHMYPEESVQAAIDARARVSIPVHWGGFALALHSWKDPIERFVAEAEKKGASVCAPGIGEVVVLGNGSGTGNWWRELR